MNNLIQYHQDPTSCQQLRLVVAGSAGSGKSYLINCLVYGIRKLFNSNKAVQAVCPTGSSANLISGVTQFSENTTGRKATKDMKPPEGFIEEALQRNCQIYCVY